MDDPHKTHLISYTTNSKSDENIENNLETAIPKNKIKIDYNKLIKKSNKILITKDKGIKFNEKKLIKSSRNQNKKDLAYRYDKHGGLIAKNLFDLLYDKFVDQMTDENNSNIKEVAKVTLKMVEGQNENFLVVRTNIESVARPISSFCYVSKLRKLNIADLFDPVLSKKKINLHKISLIKKEIYKKVHTETQREIDLINKKMNERVGYFLYKNCDDITKARKFNCYSFNHRHLNSISQELMPYEKNGLFNIVHTNKNNYINISVEKKPNYEKRFATKHKCPSCKKILNNSVKNNKIELPLIQYKKSQIFKQYTSDYINYNDLLFKQNLELFLKKKNKD